MKKSLLLFLFSHRESAAFFTLSGRALDNLDALHFGIPTQILYAKRTTPVPGAQWTGIVTQIAIDMLESGKVSAAVPDNFCWDAWFAW